MRSLHFCFLLIISLSIITRAAAQIIKINNSEDCGIFISDKTEDSFNLQVIIGNINITEIETFWGVFTILNSAEMQGEHLKTGTAILPTVNKIIDIPYGAEVNIEMVSFKTREISLSDLGYRNPLFPYQGSIEKTPDAIRNHVFKMEKSYYKTVTLENLPVIEFQEIGNLRGHRLGRVTLNVVQYYPALNKIKIFTDINIKISFSNADISLTQQIHRKNRSTHFDPLLKEFVINYQSPNDNMFQHPVHYVVIYDDMFSTDLEPLIKWKKQKGFQVTAAAISAIGNNTTAIKNYLQVLYNGPNPPTFVTLVGDKQQITTFNGQTGSHDTDLYYTTMTIGDFLPDIYIGRLSAQNSSQLMPQLNKILLHEQYQFPQTSFLNRGCFVATDDTWNYTIAEETHNYVINTHFIPNNLQYDKLYAITYGSTGQDVINAINNGRFILNYSGHGSTTGWGGPSVSQSMVSNTTNSNKYPFVISNACFTGSFGMSECFGETWVRTNNGGGLAFTGATNFTYWDEDDVWERRAYDGVFWENYLNLAAFIFRGNLAVLNAGYNKAQYYFEVYHLFGDPSICLYWGESPAMTVNGASVIPVGSSAYDVTVIGEDSALVSLYQNGINYGTALTNINGQAQIQLNPTPSSAGTMLLTVTKFNRQPYIDTLQVITASGPYLFCLHMVVDDALNNNNGIPEAGETLDINLEITNLGNADAINVQAFLSTTDTLVQIQSGQFNLGTVSAGDTVNGGAFTIHLSENMDHLHSCSFNLSLSDNNNNVWNQTLLMTVRKGGLITTSVNQVSFENTFLNCTSNEMIQINNNGPDTLFISDIQCNLSEFSASPASFHIPPLSSEIITLSFTPQSAQSYSDTFTIYNSDPVNFEHRIPVNGMGIFAPDISANPDSISIALNHTDSLTLPVAIINEGLGNLIYNAQIAGYPPGGSPTDSSGGADNYGHIWIDSNEPDGPVFEWIDISQTGTEVNISGNNAISDVLDIGFTFSFYGIQYNTFRVCTNGWLSFNSYSVTHANTILPSNYAPRSLVAPLWDDLNFSTDSKVYFQQESNKAITLFQNVYRLSGEGPYTFEVIIYENGNILFQYLSLNNMLHDYTVGIQNHGADDGLTIAYNQNYLTDSLAILISRHSWASVSPLSGTLAPQTSDTLFLTLKTGSLPQGEFWATIQLESNDPDEPLFYIPIHMVVDSSTVGISLSNNAIPENFELLQNYPNPFNPSTHISYSIAYAEKVNLTIFNILGQQVRVLVDAVQKPAFYRITWDGTNDYGRTAASGIYIYRLQAGSHIFTRKMILTR